MEVGLALSVGMRLAQKSTTKPGFSLGCRVVGSSCEFPIPICDVGLLGPVGRETDDGRRSAGLGDSKIK
jgi:hypothetical protein